MLDSERNMLQREFQVLQVANAAHLFLGRQMHGILL